MPKVGSSDASLALDLTRGLAALAVFAGHERGLFLADYPRLDHPGPALRLLYFCTGLGHLAVIVFFVLSGFFIGASVLQSRAAGRWSWRIYLVNRLARLYVVLLPALLLGLLWDHLGVALTGIDGIYGGGQVTSGIVSWSVPERLGLPVLLGNVLFLQEILVPPLGSNGPLWSLSYEFWYYVLFPLLVLALARGEPPRSRWLAAALVAALAAMLGPKIDVYFLAWLAGVGCYLAPRWETLAGPRRAWAAVAVAIFLFAAALAAARVIQAEAMDAPVAVATTLLVYALLHLPAAGSPPAYARPATLLAGCSYSLYLVHLPLLVLLRAVLLPTGDRWLPTPAHLTAAATLFTGVLGYAWLLSRLTEARTDQARRWLLARLVRQTAPAHVPEPLPQPEPVAGSRR